MIHWGIDDPEEITKWGMGIQFIEEQYFTSNEELKNLGIIVKIMYKLSNLFKTAKKAHRLLIYRVE